MPGPLHPGGHSAAGLSLSPWPRMCTGLEQHQGSDDGNEERNRNAYGHSQAGRHPECGRPPAGSAPGSGTGAGGGQRPAPPPRTAGRPGPETPVCPGPRSHPPAPAGPWPVPSLLPGARSHGLPRLGRSAPWSWLGGALAARRPARVLDGGPVSDGARAHVQMRLSAVLKKERVWGAPPRPLPQCWRTLLI